MPKLVKEFYVTICVFIICIYPFFIGRKHLTLVFRAIVSDEEMSRELMS